MMARKRTNGRRTANSDINTRLMALRQDLDALQADMKGLMEDAAGAASGHVQHAVNGAMESAQDVAERVNDWSNENLDGVRDAVRSQPLAACVLSMSAGAIIGALLLR
jgi:ElaB/YqjD/DUF883 family membrane-anchored ribosome-binding protein